ncbi:galactokinase [Maribacter sp. Asnod2-G09]|uniref:galactokinase n=1 Tax=Maribacter sp. Asnod2-G09 TaxID=3160577 RepID=UPI003870DF5F
MKEIEFNSKKWDLIIDSPGRINIIGEHTDYNNGFVLPTAIDKKNQLKFNKNKSATTCNIHSCNFNASLTFELDSISTSDNQWENYVLGVIYELQQLTDKLKGFDCILDSDIPVGSGISSSAALECGIAYGLNELFELGLSKQEIVALSQRAEHNYVGTKCGIMDQFSSVMSKAGHVILLDCKSLDHEYVPIAIAPYKILLLNTNVSHNLASGEYNVRRSQCEEGVAIIHEKYNEVSSLRDVSMTMLAEFKNELSEDVFNRCTYIIEEKERVLKSVEALKESSLHQSGKYMFETHHGLQHLYDVSCPELDYLVDFSKCFDEVIGSRMMGGGFGGCTINLIHEDAVAHFIEEATNAYYNKFNIKLTAFEAMPSEGTCIKTNNLYCNLA